MGKAKLTSNRRIILLVSMLVLVSSLIALAQAFLRLGRCPVNIQPMTCEMLCIGMNEQEVEAVLGGPAGDYTTRPDVDYFFVSVGGRSQNLKIKEWNSDEYAIRVYFDPDGKAAAIYGARGRPSSSMSYPRLLLWRIKRFFLGP